MSSFEKDFNKAMAAVRSRRTVHGMDRGSTRGRVTRFGGQKREVIGDRLFSGKAWTLERVTRPNGTGFYQLTDLAGSRTDFPVVYHDGTVAYDNPERLPKSVRAWTERLLKKFEEKQGVHGYEPHGPWITLGTVQFRVGAQPYQATIKIEKEGPYTPDVYVFLDRPYKGQIYDDRVANAVSLFLRKKGYKGPSLGWAESGMQGRNYLVLEPSRAFDSFARKQGFKFVQD